MKNRITREPVVSYHIELWGMTGAWGRAIQEKFLEAAPTGQAETCTCPANFSCWGHMTEEEADAVDKVIKPLLNLARPSESDPDDVYYE